MTGTFCTPDGGGLSSSAGLASGSTMDLGVFRHPPQHVRLGSHFGEESLLSAEGLCVENFKTPPRGPAVLSPP